MEKVDNLIKALEDSKEIQEMKALNEQLKEKKELLEDIKKYQETNEESLRQKIIEDPFFRKYKKKENECNFLILEINQKLKEMIGKDGSCENH